MSFGAMYVFFFVDFSTKPEKIFFVPFTAAEILIKSTKSSVQAIYVAIIC